MKNVKYIQKKIAIFLDYIKFILRKTDIKEILFESYIVILKIFINKITNKMEL